MPKGSEYEARHAGHQVRTLADLPMGPVIRRCEDCPAEWAAWDPPSRWLGLIGRGVLVLLLLVMILAAVVSR